MSGEGEVGVGMVSSAEKAGKAGVEIPNELCCCITREIMREPVVAVDGFVYEKSAITTWIETSWRKGEGLRSPMTNEELASPQLVPCHPIKALITSFLASNPELAPHSPAPVQEGQPAAAEPDGIHGQQSTEQHDYAQSGEQQQQEGESGVSHRPERRGQPQLQRTNSHRPNLRMMGNMGRSSRHLILPVWQPEALPEVPPDESLGGGVELRQMQPQTADSGASEEMHSLQLHVEAEFDTLCASEGREVAAVVSIKSLAPLNSEIRPALDLVAVVDSSGSMYGEKMHLLCQSLRFLVGHLTERDRFSIVAFSHRPSVLTGLTVMDQSGRSRTLNAIETSHKLGAGGGTDLASGVKLGLKILNSRRQCNQITSLLLLTDGQDDDAISLCMEGSEGLSSSLPEGCTLHCFGFGSDHDPRILCKIAEAGGAGGTFTLVEQVDTLGRAFANCLGGLLSVVAQSIRLRIQSGSSQSAGNTSLKKCLSHFKHWRGPDTSRTEAADLDIDIGNMYHEEQKDIVLLLEVCDGWEAPNSHQVLLEVECIYTAPGSESSKVIGPAKLSIWRSSSIESVSRSLRVDGQRNRIVASDAMAAAAAYAEDNKLEDAIKSLENAKQIISSSESATERLSLQLFAELEEAERRFRGRDSQGAAFSRNHSMMHRLQRSATFRGTIYTTNTQNSLIQDSFRLSRDVGAANDGIVPPDIDLPETGDNMEVEESVTE